MNKFSYRQLIEACGLLHLQNHIRKGLLTLFETGGGQICPGRHKPVCHFRAKCARVTKIHDFVPFHVRLVLEKLFFKFSIFF